MSVVYITEWKKDSAKKSNAVKQIIKDFTANKTNEESDKTTQEINKEVTKKIDCLDCANCCKTTVTTFNEEDISRASKFLGEKRKKFINKYLIYDFGEYTTITTPCPFLLDDNKCKIYNVRPYSCNSFPHTHKKNFIAMATVHQMNYSICPITYQVVKMFEEIILNQKTKKLFE